MHKPPLFRKAALEKRQVKWLGEVILIRPISFCFLSATAATLAFLIICFFALGQYTKRSTISGVLSPDIGVIKVYSFQAGVVLQKLVREGQLVRKGSTLYVISSERQNTSTGGLQAAVSQQVAMRQQSLQDEILHTRQLQRDEADALRKKIAGLQAEQSNIEQQIIGQRARLELAVRAMKRAEQLLAQGYVSAEMAQQKQAEFLDQRSRLDSLERDRLGTTRELQAQQSELASMPLRQGNGVAQLERMLVSTNQEWTESEGKRIFTIVAPEDGIATAAVPKSVRWSMQASRSQQLSPVVRRLRRICMRQAALSDSSAPMTLYYYVTKPIPIKNLAMLSAPSLRSPELQFRRTISPVLLERPRTVNTYTWLRLKLRAKPSMPTASHSPCKQECSSKQMSCRSDASSTNGCSSLSSA